MSNPREPQVLDTFLALTDTLVSDYDPLDMLSVLAERSVELLEVSAAGIILTDGNGGGLSVAAASSERARLLEVFAVAIEDGPCTECLQTGAPVVAADLTDTGRWPRFSAGAAEAGFRAVHAVPMRMHGHTVGVLTLLHTEPLRLDQPDARLAQALADAATVGLLHNRAVRRAEAVAAQLQKALDTRVLIEQAKGVLAARTDTTPDDAFTVLRGHARIHGLRLSQLSRDVIEGSVDLTTILRPDR